MPNSNNRATKNPIEYSISASQIMEDGYVLFIKLVVITFMQIETDWKTFLLDF